MNKVDIDLKPVSGDTVLRVPPLTKTIGYINNSHFDIVVTEPNGSYYRVGSTSSISDNTFIVNVTYHSQDTRVDLSGLECLMEPKVYQNFVSEIKTIGFSTISYVIPNIDQLYHTDCLFIQQLGLCLSDRPLGLNAGDVFRENVLAKNANFSLSVALVTNNPELKQKHFVRFYTAMAEVMPMYSRFHKEGVYLIIQGGEDVENGRYLRYDFDEPISPVRVFESEETARRFRVEDAFPELEDMKRKHEERVREEMRKIGELKADMELQHKEALNGIARDRAVMDNVYREQELVWKQRNEISKSYYESKSMERKDRSESLKAFPALLTAGLAVLGLLI